MMEGSNRSFKRFSREEENDDRWENSNPNLSKASSSSIAPTDDDDEDDSDSLFVDYTPPPDVKILPPAKFKLWIIVYVLVYFASWAADASQFQEFLRFHGWLSPGASLFAMLGIIVFVLVYSTMDLVIACLTITASNGKVYGVGAWLKQPRAQWMYNRENLFYDVMARLIPILEDGFSMFDYDNDHDEHYYYYHALAMQNRHHQQASYNLSKNDSGTHAPVLFECRNHNCEKVLRIEHRIRADKLEDYKKWTGRIRNAIQHAHGFVDLETSEILVRKQHGDIEDGKMNQRQAEGKSASSHSHLSGQDSNTDNGDDDDDALYQVVHAKFANLEYMNDWMLSPRRKALMRALEPMLVVPDVVKVRGMRQLPDAFTDLLTRQGQAVPQLPPKKWKVWWLTLVALFITLRWTGSFLPYYYDQWGLSDADERLERIVSSLVSTFLNSYVMVPLFLFLFSNWLHRSDGLSKTNMSVRDPWKTLDQGFESIWAKFLLTFVYYGGCVIAVILKVNK